MERDKPYRDNNSFRRINQVVGALLLAGLLGLADKITDPDRLPYQVTSFSDVVTLPVTISDDEITGEWTIDTQWIQKNCDDNGKAKGTGIPPDFLKITSKFNQPSYLDVANSFCHFYGNNPPAP